MSQLQRRQGTLHACLQKLEDGPVQQNLKRYASKIVIASLSTPLSRSMFRAAALNVSGPETTTLQGPGMEANSSTSSSADKRDCRTHVFSRASKSPISASDASGNGAAVSAWGSVRSKVHFARPLFCSLWVKPRLHHAAKSFNMHISSFRQE